MTKQERSALLRMAGNIAPGLLGVQFFGPDAEGPDGGRAFLRAVAHMSVSIAIQIADDERLKVTE